MDIAFDCIPCTIQSYLRLVHGNFIPESIQENLLRRILVFLSEIPFDQSPPAMARDLHRLIREALDNDDPYREIKDRTNRMMMEKADALRQQIKRSGDPFDTAMRLAIAGNVIDFGAKHLLDIDASIASVLKANLAIDHSAQLKQALKTAKTVLYIGDNAGEIVMDRLFMEVIAHPNIYFAVRERPVLNDITLADAKTVGIDQVAQPVTTGDDAPGVIWETSSPAFKTLFNEADVVISKGQGNLEGLIDMPRPVYFLFVAKCDRIARRVNVAEKSFVVWKNTVK